ncbi:isopenicillin N synthase family dioxygenase [Corynebacterium variabile]|uniref:isopenicillin N synthase family dioxygenase n=1 Tax=Corynebacterium variabile TaxID=1727 RepID=UPI002FE1EB3C
MSRTIPVIDISPFRDGTDPGSVVDAVLDSCLNTGFLVITGHGVPASVRSKALEAADTFFARPMSEKPQYINPQRGSGYSEFANMALGRSQGDDVPPDLREEFRIRRVDIIDWQSSLWNGDESLRAALSDYYVAMDRLADTVMEIFALSLDRPVDYFRRFTDRHDSQLGVYHYPPMTQAPLPGQLRGGAHTDFGSLTLLMGSPSVGGLQVFTEGEWEDVPVVADSVVVNIGDLMQRWTNDRWHSTLHRVANPADGDWDRARYSLAFFHQPQHDARIENLYEDSESKYPSVTSGEHFRQKMNAMVLAGADSPFLK